MAVGTPQVCILTLGRSHLHKCPCTLPWESSASVPRLVWYLGVASLWLTPSLSVACFALLGAAGQGWLGTEGTTPFWWPPAWPGHTAPRRCEGWGGSCLSAVALVPEGCGWIFGAPVRLSAPVRVGALLHLLSEHSKLQHPLLLLLSVPRCWCARGARSLPPPRYRPCLAGG